MAGKAKARTAACIIAGILLLTVWIWYTGFLAANIVYYFGDDASADPSLVTEVLPYLLSLDGILLGFILPFVTAIAAFVRNKPFLGVCGFLFTATYVYQAISYVLYEYYLLWIASAIVWALAWLLFACVCLAANKKQNKVSWRFLVTLLAWAAVVLVVIVWVRNFPYLDFSYYEDVAFLVSGICEIIMNIVLATALTLLNAGVGKAPKVKMNAQAQPIPYQVPGATAYPVNAVPGAVYPVAPGQVAAYQAAPAARPVAQPEIQPVAVPVAPAVAAPAAVPVAAAVAEPQTGSWNPLTGTYDAAPAAVPVAAPAAEPVAVPVAVPVAEPSPAPAPVSVTQAATPAETALDTAVAAAATANATAQQIAELKTLLDEGILSQEEFDAAVAKYLG